jgi:hypothetical protein
VTYRPTFHKPKLVLHGLRALRRLADTDASAAAMLIRIAEDELSKWLRQFIADEQAGADREAAEQAARELAERKARK